MKLHQINRNSEIYVAKLTSGINMCNINSNIDKLVFKKILTKEDNTYLAEWCFDKVSKNRINCKNSSLFDRVGNILVFNENSNKQMFVAIVHSKDMSFYVNIGE